MQIEIEKRSALKSFTGKAKSKLEDAALWILERLPEAMLSDRMAERMGEILDRKISRLKGAQIKNTWRTLELEKAVKEIREKS